MTNALNNNNIDTNEITNNTYVLASALKNTANTTSDTSFSNLINNVNAKTQQAQTDINKSLKTNFSSINKKSLENSKVTTSKQVKTSKTDSSTKTSDFKKQTSQAQNTKNSENTNSDNKINTTNSKKPQQTNVKEDIKQSSSTKTSTNQDDLKAIKEDTNLSDINNSSPVEPSPVSSTENVSKEDTSKLENQSKDEIIATLLASLNLSTNTGDDIQNEVGDILNSIDNIQDVSDAIESIFASLDNSNLSDENKEAFKNLLQNAKINSSVASSKNQEVASDFVNTLKNVEQEISSFLDENLKNTTFDENLNSTQNKVEVLNSIDENLKVSDKNEDKTSSTFENSSKTETLEVSTLNNSDNSDELNNINNSIDLNETKENLKTENSETKNSSKTEKETVSKIENLEDLKADILEKLNSLDIQKPEIKEQISSLIQKINELNSDEIKSSDDNSKEISLEDLKNEISNLIKNNEKINNEKITGVDENITNNSLRLNVSNLKQETNETTKTDNKIDIQDVFKENALKNVNENASETVLNNPNKTTDENFESEIKLEVDDLNLKNNKETSSFDFSKNNNSTKNSSENETSSNLQTKNIFSQKLGDIEEISMEDNSNIKVENLETEENLEKQIALEKIDENILNKAATIDASKANIVESGALSVSDEVAKLSLEESGTINSTTTKGGVIYDSASGNGSLIKNVVKPSFDFSTKMNSNIETSDNSVLNQITDKLQQLKDGQGQKLTMVLRPNDLGRLSIELVSNSSGLTTQIVAQNDDVRKYIEQNINTLRQQLNDAGINVNNIQIKTSGQEGSTNYDGNMNSQDNSAFQEENSKQNNSGQNFKQNKQNHNEERQIFTTLQNFDHNFTKDFSSVLNKSISYSLN